MVVLRRSSRSKRPTRKTMKDSPFEYTGLPTLDPTKTKKKYKRALRACTRCASAKVQCKWLPGGKVCKNCKKCPSECEKRIPMREGKRYNVHREHMKGKVFSHSDLLRLQAKLIKEAEEGKKTQKKRKRNVYRSSAHPKTTGNTLPRKKCKPAPPPKRKLPRASARSSKKKIKSSRTVPCSSNAHTPTNTPPTMTTTNIGLREKTTCKAAPPRPNKIHHIPLHGPVKSSLKSKMNIVASDTSAKDNVQCNDLSIFISTPPPDDNGPHSPSSVLPHTHLFSKLGDDETVRRGLIAFSRQHFENMRWW